MLDELNEALIKRHFLSSRPGLRRDDEAGIHEASQITALARMAPVGRHPNEGQRAMPLALRLSEGLGLRSTAAPLPCRKKNTPRSLQAGLAPPA